MEIQAGITTCYIMFLYYIFNEFITEDEFHEIVRIADLVNQKMTSPSEEIKFIIALLNSFTNIYEQPSNERSLEKLPKSFWVIIDRIKYWIDFG
jgi:hypothetical protein